MRVGPPLCCVVQVAFPQFAYEFYSKRLGLRSLVDQACRELLFNVQVSRKEFLEVEIFARFLEVRPWHAHAHAYACTSSLLVCMRTW